MNEAELERAIAKLKARLLMDKGEESSSANGEIRRRLVRLQTLRIKLKEMEEVFIDLISAVCVLGKICIMRNSIVLIII